MPSRRFILGLKVVVLLLGLKNYFLFIVWVKATWYFVLKDGECLLEVSLLEILTPCK